MRLEISAKNFKKKHKQVAAKQHAAKQQMGHWANFKIPGNKWKCKHNDSEINGMQKHS